MFRLHDTTRRRICLATFFLLCVVPTVLVAGWCVARHLPGHVRAEARRLTRELGLRVSLKGLRHLRPGGVLYEGLELADPETGNTVLRCRVLEAQWTQSAREQQQPRDLLILIASQPEVAAGGLDQLGELLRRILHCKSGRPEADVRLTAGEVTLEAGENSHTLTDVRGSIDSLPGGVQAHVVFHLAGSDISQPIRVRAVRNRQTTPPTSGLELDTGGQAVPCSALAIGLPLLEPLGSRAEFCGYVWANQTPGGRTPDDWDGEMTGWLLGVDLGALVTEWFPHKLSGTGQVVIHSARLRQGRLEEASGTLAAGPGVISRSLLDAAAGHLRMVPGGQPQVPGDLVPYEQLAVAFLINSEGLRLQGRCSVGGPDTILVGGRGRLLGGPGPEPQPVAGLLRTLVPASRLHVPATRQTDWLMRRLPVPRIVPPEVPEGTLPTARLRLGQNGNL